MNVSSNREIHPNLQRWLETYSALGKPLFALHRESKKPFRGSHGFKDATTDVEQLLHWAHEHPGCNWGMATGRVSGITVIDFDRRHGGEDTYEELKRRYGDFEPAVQQLTGNGWHDGWAYVPGTGSHSNALGPGADVKSDGGYILVCPSIHPVTHHRYLWEVSHDIREHGLTPMPEWMKSLLLTGHPESAHTVDGLRQLTPAEVWAKIFSEPSEQRHDTIRSFTGYLLVRGVAGYAALGIAHLWNRLLARPGPLPDAEVERIVRNIARRELERRKGRP
jgi:hypothetical protein